MSVCSCSWDGGTLGVMVKRNRTARSMLDRGRSICPNCGYTVEVGSPCIDVAGLHEEGGGFWGRFHEPCFLLMELFAEKVCGGAWHFPFDLDEASEHAMAHADDPYWREWLELYARTWAWTPEPPDPRPSSEAILTTDEYLERSLQRYRESFAKLGEQP